MGLIAASGLGKRFGNRWIFRGIEFDLTVGDSLAVLGRNGIGKSTLLKVLAGLSPATTGKVVRGTIGYAALDLALWPQLTAREHVLLAARLRGESGAIDLAEIGLAGAEDQPVKEYSTGMRARLKLALATAHRPEVLILDEPTAALDEEGRRLVERLVGEQLQHGAVIVATNDQTDRRLATHEITLA